MPQQYWLFFQRIQVQFPAHSGSQPQRKQLTDTHIDRIHRNHLWTFYPKECFCWADTLEQAILSEGSAVLCTIGHLAAQSGLFCDTWWIPGHEYIKSYAKKRAKKKLSQCDLWDKMHLLSYPLPTKFLGMHTLQLGGRWPSMWKALGSNPNRSKSLQTSSNKLRKWRPTWQVWIYFGYIARVLLYTSPLFSSHTVLCADIRGQWQLSSLSGLVGGLPCVHKTLGSVFSSV